MFPELCGDHSLSSVRQGLSFELATSARLAGLRATRTQLSLAPTSAGVSDSYCNALPRFCMGSGVPNVGPHIYTVLPTEPSTPAQLILVLFYTVFFLDFMKHYSHPFF